MSDVDTVVVPYKSVGPYRFGMTPADCAAAAGPADSAREDVAMGWFREKRAGVEAVFAKRKLIQVVFGDSAKVSVAGCEDVLKNAAASIAALQAADSGFKEKGAYIDFPNLGVCLGGMGKKKLPEGKHVIVYAKSQRQLMDILGTV